MQKSRVKKDLCIFCPTRPTYAGGQIPLVARYLEKPSLPWVPLSSGSTLHRDFGVTPSSNSDDVNITRQLRNEFLP